MPITYHPHQGRTVQKAVESEVPVQQSVAAFADIALSVSASPVSEVGLSTQVDLESVTELSLSSGISVGQVVDAGADTAIQVSVSPTSAVSVSSTQESVVFAAVEVSTSITVGQAVSASTDTAIQVSASPSSAVDLSSTATKEVEYPVYERTASSTINVGQSVSASTDTSSLSSVSPTSSVGVSSSVTTEVDTPTNTAPTASLTVTDDPSGDLVVEADAQGSSDPDNDSLTFDYDWGDGTTDTGAGSIATHTYSSEGTYTVTVTVDDGTATDQASQDVTVSTSSSGSEVVHDFEGGDEGWVSVASGFGRTTTYARNGSYSYGGGVDSAQAGELAYVEPPELSGGNKIESLTYHWLEEVFSYGGGVRLYDSSGSSVIGFLTDNPQWKVLNGSGSITQLYDGGGAYEDWIKVEVTFDWSAGTADVTYTNESTGTSRTENGVSIGGNGVEKIQLTNHNGESFGSGNCYYWVDDLQFTPSTSTSGPSFNDGVEESFTKEGSNTASHDASWDGSAAPYSFRIYKDSSKQTLIYSNALVYNTSDNQSNYTTSTSINDLTFGSTVYFEVTDNNGNSSTTSVSTSVAF